MRLAMAGILGLLLAACQPAAPAADGAWVRLPAVPGRPGAAYFTLTGGAEPRSLVAVRTPAAARTELHESMAGDHGAMTMAPLRTVVVPAGQTVRFAPGGKHVMLFDVSPALAPGGETMLTLAFADGSTLETTATVRGAADPAP